MPLILETIVTTLAPSGELHLVPFGLIGEPDGDRLRPVRPPPPTPNLQADPRFPAPGPLASWPGGRSG